MWSRKNIYEIPPCAHHVIFITEFVLLFDQGHNGRICHILCVKAYLLGSYKTVLEYLFFRVKGHFPELLYNLPEKNLKVQRKKPFGASNST